MWAGAGGGGEVGFLWGSVKGEGVEGHFGCGVEESEMCAVWDFVVVIMFLQARCVVLFVVVYGACGSACVVVCSVCAGGNATTMSFLTSLVDLMELSQEDGV